MRRGWEIDRVRVAGRCVEGAGWCLLFACFLGFLDFGAEWACFGVLVAVWIEIADAIAKICCSSVVQAQVGVVVDVCPLEAIPLDTVEEGLVFVLCPGVAFSSLSV